MRNYNKWLLAALSSFGLLTVSNAVAADILTVTPSNPEVANCYPFANADSWTPYMGFIYQNIPAFTIAPGDEIAFDTGLLRDGPPVQLAIHMVATTTNGGSETAGPLTQLVSNTQTPQNPNGDDIIDNFEMVFTSEGSFSFPGGGLVIAFSDPSATYQAESGCEQVLVNAEQTDPSGLFVQRFFRDDNGQSPFAETATGDIGGFQIRTGDDVGGEAATSARFHVTKTFNDGAEDEVDVAITCNGGLPLQQTYTISGGGSGVSFVVTDFIEGSTQCEVTETSDPGNYTPSYNGGAGCVFSNLTPGQYSCAISNEANPGTYTVNMDWEPAEGGSAVDETVEVSLICNAAFTVDSNPATPDVPEPGFWSYDEDMSDGDSLVAIVDTSNGVVSCQAVQGELPSGVESVNQCGLVDISAGGEEECTISNTMFFEGIPTLGRHGLALMVLLMLSAGLIGFRRLA
ncbi:MAG: hypothetical protein V2I48_06715 [Xanthomonadales bacterium]|nr:hypothetical protein [Xanthomonadales bacterium]